MIFGKPIFVPTQNQTSDVYLKHEGITLKAWFTFMLVLSIAPFLLLIAIKYVIKLIKH